MRAAAEPGAPRRRRCRGPGLPAALAALLALAACPRVARPTLDADRHAEPDVDGAVHVVQPGETLWRIARRYGVLPEALARANGLSDAAALKAGQELFVPFEPEAPAATPGPSAANAPLAWPLKGVLYARFGPRGETRHDGVDVAAPEGTEIRAAADGEVLFSGEQKGYGMVVIVQHAGGLITVYAHNRENLVREGRKVRQGDPLATVGVASRTSGPHLHFEVRQGTSPQDPLRYLPPPS
jgi:lipoprotein NlpD